MLAAFDRLDGDGRFTRDDEQLLEAFAAQAATAVATAKSVEADRRRRSLAAAEAERHRWARELHDETLQALGGLKVLLSSATRLDDPEAMRAAMREATQQLTGDIESLRCAHRRAAPAGPRPARPRARARLARAAHGRRPTASRSTPTCSSPTTAASAPRLETTVYRVVQESLTNVVKHARAASVELAVRCAGDEVEVRVADDGIGFDPEDWSRRGFGLAGMRERVELAGGELSVASGAEAGTVVRARLPCEPEPSYCALTNPWSSA